MAYYNENRLQQYFESAIEADSNKKIEKLRKEIDALYQKEMKRIKNDLEIKKQLALSKALKTVHLNHQDQMNQIGIGYDELLIQERKRMIDSIFDAVYARLKAHLKSNDYQHTMKQKIKKVIDYAAGNEIQWVVSVNDTFLTTYLKELSLSYTASYAIQSGGFQALIPSKNAVIDETIDQKIEEQKLWFYNNAKLFVKQ